VVIRVGVTGHSDLTPLSHPVVASAVRRALAPHRGPALVGVSCLAPGADQIFAEAVLDLGGLLEVILPAPDYRERKIPEDNARRFDRLVDAASSVRIISRISDISVSLPILDWIGGCHCARAS